MIRPCLTLQSVRTFVALLPGGFLVEAEGRGRSLKMKFTLFLVASVPLLIEATCPETATDLIPSKETRDSFPNFTKDVTCKAFIEAFKAAAVTLYDDIAECEAAFKAATGYVSS